MADRPPGYRVLEVGCGTGSVLRVLKEACPEGLVIGMDYFEEGLSWARARAGCPLIQGDLQAPPFAARFDLIGLFDVLEHVEDDERALRDLHALLNPDAVLLLTVPAHASLWSYWDEVCQHHRRYSVAELKSKLVGAGFRVEYLTEFMSLLYPLMWLGRRLRTAVPARREDERRKLAERELRILPGVNGLLEWLLRPETRLVAGRRTLPLGTSLVAVTRKPAGETQYMGGSD
jgi:SAM-dependent methyltransferase